MRVGRLGGLALWTTLVVAAVFVLRAPPDKGRREPVAEPPLLSNSSAPAVLPDRLLFYEGRAGLNLSRLGEALFRGAPFPDPRPGPFNILVWREGKFLERRHMRAFSNTMRDPFEGCSVNNCRITYDAGELEASDAVVVHLHRLPSRAHLPREERPRRPGQRWIFLSDESPKHTFLHGGNDWRGFAGLFNWSMNYKAESDVPVPYGRTEPLPPSSLRPAANVFELVPFAGEKRRDVLVAIMISNCGGVRMEYLRELRRHLEVHVYGACGDAHRNTCPGHFGAECPDLRRYLFYLAFENTLCDQYMTEKCFWNAYHYGAVPVVLGPSKEFCRTHLPPASYLHVDEYARPADLARHLLLMNATWDDELFRYHRWRRAFRVSDEHGYFGTASKHYCRACEALNYNDAADKVYGEDELAFFLSPEANCR